MFILFYFMSSKKEEKCFQNVFSVSLGSIFDQSLKKDNHSVPK